MYSDKLKQKGFKENIFEINLPPDLDVPVKKTYFFSNLVVNNLVQKPVS